jgi:hypothetical protein
MKLAHQRLGEINSRNNALLEEVASYKKQLMQSSTGTVPPHLTQNTSPPNVDSNVEYMGSSLESSFAKDVKFIDPDTSNVSGIAVVKSNLERSLNLRLS